jgi:hypothetical protein
MTVIRRNEGTGVSVALRSIVDDSAGGVAELYALRESAKKLIRLQAKDGFSTRRCSRTIRAAER